MTQALLHAGLVNAALALLLAVPAALAGRFLRHRPAVVHGLWLLVLLKLVTPPMVEVPLFWPAEESTPPAEVVLPPVTCMRPTIVEAGGPVIEPAPAQPVEEEVTVAAPFDWRTPLLLAWLGGAISVWWLAFARLGRLEQLLSQLPSANDDIQDRVTTLSRRLGLRRAPRLWLVPGVVPPLLLAFGRAPRLLVPAGLWARLDDDQRDALLLHELAHLRRGDPWVRLLELVAVSLFWWYPLAWLAGRALRDSEELCCDAWVVWAAPESAGAYAGALVETVGFLSGLKAALPLVASGAAPVRFLQRRLAMILRHQPSRRLSPGALIALVVGGLCVLPLVPGLAQSPRDKAPAEALSVERVVNESPACQACHSPVKPGVWNEWRLGLAGGHSDKMHNEIVKLLGVLKVQRDSVAKTEKQLRDLLDRFESANGKKPAGPKEADKRLDDLEKKLEGILKELQDLRKERRVPRSAVPQALPGHTVYYNHRAIEIPFQIQPDRKAQVREVVLHQSKDRGLTWEVISRALPSDHAFDFTAPGDGIYAFRAEVVNKDGREATSNPDAAMVVVFDTVKPVVDLSATVNDQGQVKVGWKIVDENLDTKSLKLEYRYSGSASWQPLTVTAAHSGESGIITQGKVAEVRLRVRDLAGNNSERKVPVTVDPEPAPRPSTLPKS